MKKPPFRDIHVHVGYGELRCALVAEGVSWSPDVASDMVTRMGALWSKTLEEAYMYGLLDTDEDDDDEFGPTPDKELVDPRITFVQDDGDEDA